MYGNTRTGLVIERQMLRICRRTAKQPLLSSRCVFAGLGRSRDDAQIPDEAHWDHCIAADYEWGCGKLMLAPSRCAPDHLSLGCVQLQMVRPHPSSDVSNARQNACLELSVRIRPTRSIYLCVVGIHVGLCGTSLGFPLDVWGQPCIGGTWSVLELTHARRQKGRSSVQTRSTHSGHARCGRWDTTRTSDGLILRGRMTHRDDVLLSPGPPCRTQPTGLAV